MAILTQTGAGRDRVGPPGNAAADFVTFRHATPAFRTFAGHGSLDVLATELDRGGCRRAVIFCGSSMLRQTALIERVDAILGDRLVGRFSDVKEHSPIPVVRDAARLLATIEADSVIALGGGSAIVTARAATILLAEGHDVRALGTHWGPEGQLVSPRLSAVKLPIWLVPSTPTTAYSKAGSAVRDPETGDRIALFDPKTRAQGVVLDPQVALSSPAELAKGAALNAFSMSIESIQGSVDPLADALLLHALSELSQWLPQLDQSPDDSSVRLCLMVGALLAGQGSDYVGGGLAQALAHAAGPRSSVSNGVVESILLPHTMRYNAPAVPGRLALVARVLDRLEPADPGAAEAADDERAIEGVDRLCIRLGIPRRLRDVGVVRGDLGDIAAHTLDDWSLTRIPRRVGREELFTLLEAAW